MQRAAQSSFFVVLTLPSGLSAVAREPLSALVLHLAARFSFQGLEDWSVDVPNSRVLGAESEFHDLTHAGTLHPEMRAYFEQREDAALFARILRATIADIKVGNARRLAPRDWMKAWRKHYRTQRIREGRETIAIVPAWRKAPRGSATSVRISPGQAFGTGTHATTRLCLRLLLRHGARAKTALDFGAGTGVLLLAAHRWAGMKGHAVESDLVALAQARKNAGLNRARGLKFTASLPRKKFDLVFGNVLAPVLLAHRAALLAALRPDGVLFLSGILKSEAASFARKFRAGAGSKIQLLERLDEGDWSAFAFRRTLPLNKA